MLLEEALNGTENRERFITGTGVLDAKYDKGYNTTIPPPNMIHSVSNGAQGQKYTAPNMLANDDSLFQDKLGQALKQYDALKSEVDTNQRDFNRIRDDPALADYNYQRPTPPEMPYLRDPAIRELYNQTPTAEPREEVKQAGLQNDLNMKQLYDQYNVQNPNNNQPNGNLNMRNVYDEHNRQNPHMGNGKNQFITD